MPRAFLAIELPLAVRSTLLECRDVMLAEDPAWRSEKWVAEQNLHVTLRFLGSVPDPACELVAERVALALSDLEPYRLRLDTLRVVPRARTASMLWVTASSGSEQTAQLAQRLAEATTFLDIPPETKPFSTHVTLVRARRPRRVSHDALDEMERHLARTDERSLSMSVREVTLIESTLTPRGPVYETMAVIPFGR
jgi:2'-5' RNA ligase